jgi:hypothetical protein
LFPDLEKGCALLRSAHGPVKHPTTRSSSRRRGPRLFWFLPLALAGCSGRQFDLTPQQMAAAEQRSFEAIQKQAPDADTLFIAHQWQAGQCRHFWLRGDFCFTRARAGASMPWTPLTAQVRREPDGAWMLMGANWPRR